MPSSIIFLHDDEKSDIRLGLPKPAWSLCHSSRYAREQRVMQWQRTPRGRRWMRKVAEWQKRDDEYRKHVTVSRVIQAMPSCGYDFDAEGVVAWLYDHGYLKDSE